MARDRQRAKQRRAKRQPGTGGARSARDLERQVGLGAGDADEAAPADRDDALDGIRADDAVDSPLGRGTAAPDPLQHASAEVDEARLAEAGAQHPRADELDEDEDDFERAPDEAEGDAPVRRSEAAAQRAERSRGRLLTFLGHSVDELRRVQWPDRRHVGQATGVVLGFVVIAGGYLGLLDAVYSRVVEAIL